MKFILVMLFLIAVMMVLAGDLWLFHGCIPGSGTCGWYLRYRYGDGYYSHLLIEETAK